MKATEYRKNLNDMEELLKILTKKGKLSQKQQKQLDLISDKVATYEEKNHAFEVDSLEEMIELRMFQRKMKQKDLAELLETTPSRISEILNGKRALTLSMAKMLYKKLNIDPALILS